MKPSFLVERKIMKITLEMVTEFNNELALKVVLLDTNMMNMVQAEIRK
jgi:hypothetical protein